MDCMDRKNEQETRDKKEKDKEREQSRLQRGHAPDPQTQHPDPPSPDASDLVDDPPVEVSAHEADMADPQEDAGQEHIAVDLAQ